MRVDLFGHAQAGPKKRTVLVRRRKEEAKPEEMKQKERKVVVARKLRPGQSIQLSNDKTVTLPAMDAVSTQKFQSLPQSLALSGSAEYAGPPRVCSPCILTHLLMICVYR